MAASKKKPSPQRGGNAEKSAVRRAQDGGFNCTKRPLFFVLALLAGVVLLATLLSYENGQPFFGNESWLKNLVVTTETGEANPMGKLGATFAVVAFNLFGLTAFMLPAFLFLFAYYMMSFRADISLTWKTFLMFLALLSGAALLEILPKDLIGFDPEAGENPRMPSLGGPGGWLGKFLFNEVLCPIIGTAGSAVFLSLTYLFCVLGLIVAAPQRTLADAVDAAVGLVRGYFEKRRQWREHQALRREAQRKAQIAAQEQLRKNKEAAEREAQNAAASAESEVSEDAPDAAPQNAVPAEFSGAETEDEDFSGVPVADDAIPAPAAPVLEEIPDGATLTPIDFDAENEEPLSAAPEGAEADAPAENAALPAGTLKVVAYKNGRKWAEDIVETTGAPAGLKASVDRGEILGDGRDLAYVTVVVADKKGRKVPTAGNRLKFSVSGNAEIVGVCNGDPTDHDSMKGDTIRAFAGMAQVILRSKRDSSGKATLKITGEGLPAETVEIKIEKPTRRQLRLNT